MTDIDSPTRIEPMLDKPASSSPASSAPTSPTFAAPVTTAAPASEMPAFSQLARIEEKAARIEEKFARTESLMLRVETAASGLSDVARKSDVDALAERVRRLPGFMALVVTSLITSAITAGAVVALFRYVLR